jgi:hypothetical protein
VVRRRSNAMSEIIYVLEEQGISWMGDCPRMILVSSKVIPELKDQTKKKYKETGVKLDAFVSTTLM